MPELARIRLYPVKGLDGIDVPESDILSGGTLAHDREFALFDTSGRVVNGKRTDRVHQLSTAFYPSTGEFTVRTPDSETFLFNLYHERDRASQWFTTYFDTALTLKRDQSLGFVDRRELGPSVISTATLKTVASWFDELTVDNVRRRLRANIEITGVPAFWEDQFVGRTASSFSINGVQFDGVTPCGRCVVPERDPDSGEHLSTFRERFLTRRQETFPAWADESAFDHFYSLMIITQIPEFDRGRSIHVGDPVDVIE